MEIYFSFDLKIKQLKVLNFVSNWKDVKEMSLTFKFTDKIFENVRILVDITLKTIT